MAVSKENMKENNNMAVAKLNNCPTAISNWQAKNKEANIEDANLYIHEIKVDSASMLKRIRTAPQGRAHRIRKRSNHVTIVLNTKENTQSN